MSTTRKRNAAVATITSTRPEDLTPQQLQLRQLIVETAEEAFRQEGIVKCTMEAIGKRLNMSKRTLYQFFHDKESLVLACVQLNTERKKAYTQQLESNSDNALHCILQLITYRLTAFKLANTYYYRELYHYPSVAAYFTQRRKESVSGILALFQRGVDEGVFDKRIDFSTVVQCLSALTDVVLQSTHGTDSLTIPQFVFNFVLPLFRGCATPKGQNIIENYKLEVRD